MPRFRSRRNSLRPINRIKHVFDQQGGLTIGAQLQINLATAVDDPVLSDQDEVQTGCTINGIYLHIEVAAVTAAAIANVYMMLTKNPANDLTFPNGNTAGTSDVKRFIIHQEMVMMEKQVGGNPRTLFNGVIVIPRGYRRFAPADTLKLLLFSPGVTVDFCLQAHYKEFR